MEDLSEIKSKVESGDYILIWKDVEPITLECTWRLNEADRLWNGVKYRCIHKKHKEILYHYLANKNPMEIEYERIYDEHINKAYSEWKTLGIDFIESYSEYLNYRIKGEI